MLALLADKDPVGFVTSLDSQVDFWYISEVDSNRGLPAQVLAKRLQETLSADSYKVVENASEAFATATGELSAKDILLVTGSFFLVAEIRSIALGRDGNNAQE